MGGLPGVQDISVAPDGSLSVITPDSSNEYFVSTGYVYAVRGGAFVNSPYRACSDEAASQGVDRFSVDGLRCTLYGASTVTYDINQYRGGCPVGSYVDSSDSCLSQIPLVPQPLETYLQSTYTGKGWNHHWAELTAGLVAAGENVFTDGTGTTISGPANVPLSQSTTQNPVNVLPSTTTPAPPGHTGPTDSGTITTTTTHTANNTFRPGSSSSGPSMQTSTQTSVSTSVTNNITNNTSTSVVNQTTQTDEAPKEKEEDFCKKNPDSLACSELDTPEGEIPRDKIEIDFEPEDLGLGAGSCPPDKPIDDIHVFSYQPTCEILDTYGYWLTIALSTFGALLIIFVGKAEP